MQEGNPLYFESCPIEGKILHKPIHAKEMLEILHALKQWLPYLIGGHLKVKIDHDNLKYFLEERLSLEDKQKWVTKMLGYDFQIIYKKEGNKIWWQMLSQENMRMSGSYFMIFYFKT